MEKIRENAPIILLVFAFAIMIVLGFWLKAAEHAFYQWLWSVF